MRLSIFSRWVFLGAFLLVIAAALPSKAELNVSLNIGVPAPIVVSAPPSMVFLPEAGVYVAVGVPYDVFYSNGRYYYYSNNHWFLSSYYDGPWVFVSDPSLPRGLEGRHIGELRNFREQEHRVFEVEREKVKFFVPQGRGRGNKHHRNEHDHND